MANEKRLIDANALIANGWHLVKTGKSNVFLASMSLADVHTVDAVEVVHSRAILVGANHIVCTHKCERCDALIVFNDNYCSNCGAKMDGGNEDG